MAAGEHQHRAFQSLPEPSRATSWASRIVKNSWSRRFTWSDAAAVALARQGHHPFHAVAIRFHNHSLLTVLHGAPIYWSDKGTTHVPLMRGTRDHLEQAGAGSRVPACPAPNHLQGNRRAARHRDPARPARCLSPRSATWPSSCASRARPCVALTTLVQSGHLISLRGRAGGTFVADASPMGQMGTGVELGDGARGLDYRVAVETGATVLAAERATAADLDRLYEYTERMKATTGPSRVPAGRRALPHRSRRGLHSPRLVAAMTEVRGR